MRESYRERLIRFEEAQGAQAGLGLRLGRARLALFVVGFLLYVAGDVSTGGLRRWSWLGAVAALAVFVFLVIWHRRVRARERWLGALVRANADALARVRRDWDALPRGVGGEVSAEHPNALDLDLCGRASLFRLLTTVTLPPGAETLRRWLLSPASPVTVRERQEAVAELAPQVDLRQTLEAMGRLTDPPPAAGVARFLAWAEEVPWILGRRWILAASWALPALSAVLVALHVRGAVVGPWWLLSMGAALALGSALRREIHPRMDAAGAGGERFGRYGTLLSTFLEAEVKAPALQRLREAVLSSPVGPERELRRLERKLAWADVRYSGMAHAPLQALLVWDVHVLAGMERWKARSGPHVRRWMEVLGELEALAALAALRADNPSWCFPAVTVEGEPRLQARDLGHPLLPPDACVGNDLEVGPPGSFVFLTGSNMSGKSTLLRAVGMNAVLGQAGGPVCAREMEMTPLAVHTSMRSSDSLERGVSQYMAELHRIRDVVGAARGSGPAPVLYLLDEPLQGTNEAERRVAVQTILGHLLDAGAIGVVATHDLSLDRTERLGAAARAVHFAGTVGEDGAGALLSFDYRLMPGRVRSTNALALLRAVGLGAEGMGEG